MASLPVYFEQRLVGTICVDKSGPGVHLRSRLDRVERRVSDLDNDAVKIGALCLRHFSALGGKPAARKRAIYELSDNFSEWRGAM